MREKEIGAELMAAAHRLKKLKMHEMAFSEISKGEYWVLKMIAKGTLENEEGCGVYVSHIAEHLKVTPSAVSRMLKGLEERELIDRKVDKKDRRNTYVFLTPKGEATRNKVDQEMCDFTDEVIKGMGEEDAILFIKLFNKMVDVMEEEIKKHNEKMKE